MTQTDSILNHLLSGKSITPIEALNLYGCFRLGARINELRGCGYEIETKINRLGKKYATYRLTCGGVTPAVSVSASDYKVQANFFNDNQFSAA